MRNPSRRSAKWWCQLPRRLRAYTARWLAKSAAPWARSPRSKCWIPACALLRSDSLLPRGGYMVTATREKLLMCARNGYLHSWQHGTFLTVILSRYNCISSWNWRTTARQVTLNGLRPCICMYMAASAGIKCRLLPTGRSRLALLLLLTTNTFTASRLFSYKHFPSAIFAHNNANVAKSVRGQATVQCALCFPYVNDRRIIVTRCAGLRRCLE